MAKSKDKGNDKAGPAPVFSRPEPSKQAPAPAPTKAQPIVAVARSYATDWGQSAAKAPSAPAPSNPPQQKQQQQASAQAVAAKDAVKQQQAAASPPQPTKQEVKAARQDPAIMAAAQSLGIKKLDKPAELNRVRQQIDLDAERYRAEQAYAAEARRRADEENERQKGASADATKAAPAIDVDAIKRETREEVLAELERRRPQPDEDYARRFQDSLDRYQQTLSTQTSALQTQLSNAQAERDAAKAERDSEKAKAEALEQRRKDEESLAADTQLRSLRSGSTIAGMPGAGLGSLQSGRPSYSAATGGKRGGVLDRAFQGMDPTDSVLNRDVASEIAKSVGAGGSRAQARQRALASGGGASRYYARRFG